MKFDYSSCRCKTIFIVVILALELVLLSKHVKPLAATNQMTRLVALKSVLTYLYLVKKKKAKFGLIPFPVPILVPFKVENQDKTVVIKKGPDTQYHVLEQTPKLSPVQIPLHPSVPDMYEDMVNQQYQEHFPKEAAASNANVRWNTEYDGQLSNNQNQIPVYRSVRSNQYYPGRYPMQTSASNTNMRYNNEYFDGFDNQYIGDDYADSY